MTDLLHKTSLIFDLDGTLVDTAPDLVAALNRTIEPEGLAPVPLETVRHMVGHGARRLIVRAHEEQGFTLPHEALEPLTAKFIEIYGENIDRFSRPFEGWSRPWTCWRGAARGFPSLRTSQMLWRCCCWSGWRWRTALTGSSGQMLFQTKSPTPLI